MKIPETKIYRLRPFTNLHVGSGETNFGVVDNLIQRDATTGLPCVHSSGLKGAIKQLCDQQNLDAKSLHAIFGSDADVNKSEDKRKNPGSKAKQAESFFFSAQLLAIPVRSEKVPYVLATCPAVLEQFLRTVEDFNLTFGDKATIENFIKEQKSEAKQAYCLNPNLANSTLAASNIAVNKIAKPEDYQAIKTLFGIADDNLCLLSNDDFLELCDDLNLPVIARNALDDGESKNLWYEQVLPRESVLYFPTLWTDIKHQEAVEKVILHHPVQIGGNASVGYGFTRITSLL